ncbi:uncharacterized protein LOC117172465 isoform X2 [Belonocnema kinseyi]|nr:uncharacterized protein LOC117172465 isoform X2 [Belonocnema kinseyi]
MADHQDYTENRRVKESREGDYLLIDLVRQNPHLYDKDLKDFKDIDKREHTWREISAVVNLNVNDCQQRWVRLREKFSKERRVQEELERSGNKEFKLSSWPFYDELRFLEPFIKRRKVYHKPRYPEQKVNSSLITPKVHTTVYNAQQFTPIKPIPTATVTQPVFKQGNLSFVQVPKTVMVQLVGNQNHVSAQSKTVESVSGESSIPNNVEVVYQNEATTSSESSSLNSENNETSSKRKKKRKRKSDCSAEDAISNLSTVIQRYLDTYKKDENPDEIFGKLIARELANRPEPEKSKLKRNIMKIIWDERDES